MMRQLRALQSDAGRDYSRQQQQLAQARARISALETRLREASSELRVAKAHGSVQRRASSSGDAVSGGGVGAVL